MCVKCKKRGHFTEVCLSTPKRVNKIAADDAEEQDKTDSKDDGFFLGAIRNKDEKVEHWSEEIEVNGVTIKFKLDTGAEVMVIGDSIYSCFFRNTNLQRAHKKLFGPCKSKLHCLGILQAKLRLNEPLNQTTPRCVPIPLLQKSRRSWTGWKLWE